MLKQILFTTLCFGVIIIVGTVIAIHAEYKQVEENVLENNPKISTIESIKRTGRFGEHSTEFTLVVSMDGREFRIWTDKHGKLIEKVELE